VIASSTYEEAPADVGRWLGQRTRWFKGWDADRQPYRLFRELGLGGFLAFQLIVGGNALVPLVHPIFMLRMIFELSASPWHEDYSVLQIALYLLIIATG
jgi:cellulose synthase/poly-beta-1,6-N-acetylglucosamine synthase-like glycosyltransferase